MQIYVFFTHCRILIIFINIKFAIFDEKRFENTITMCYNIKDIFIAKYLKALVIFLLTNEIISKEI